MSLRLKIEQGQDAGKTFGLKDGGVYVLGRDPASAVRVLDMKVSKAHCEIEVSKADGVWLRDLASTQGTWLNGSAVTGDTTLKVGDELKIGFTVLRVLADGPADVTAVASRSPGGAAAAAPASPAAQAAPPAQAGTTAKPAPAAQPRKELPPDALVGKDVGGYRVLKKVG